MSFSPVTVQQKRQAMRHEILEYFEGYSDIQDAKDYAANNHERLEIITQPPELIDCTFGMGKSAAIEPVVAEALSRQLKVCIVVPTHKLADEYCRNIPSAYHYYGRQSEEEARDDEQRKKFLCFKKDDVNVAADKNHLPSQSICRVCPHAHAHVLENVSDDVERVDKAILFFKVKGLKSENFKPCRFLYDGLPEALASDVVVITQNSFSDAMGIFQVKSGNKVQNEMQRLVIIDEKIALTKEINICAKGIQSWLDSLERLTRRLEESKSYPKLLALLPEVEDAFKTLGANIMLGKEIDKVAILDIYNRAKDAGYINSRTAQWERIDFLEQQEFLIPLRALHTLAHNLEQGTVRKSKTKTHAYEVSQLVEWAHLQGSTIFMDATAPLAMKAFISKIKGKYFDAHVDQNLVITRFSGNMYARGNVRLKRYKKDVQARMNELERIAAQLPKPAAIITHKAWLKFSEDSHESTDAAEIAAKSFFERTGVELGWFGKHERGHNDWKGFSIAIVGMPFLSKEAILSEYSGDRAALMTVGVNWPEWDGEMSEPVWDLCIPPMPKQPEIRAWLLDLYAAGIAQGIGRARAINAETPITIQLFGGLQTPEMDNALSVHGITINVTTEDTIHRTAAQYRGRGTDIKAIDEAIRQLILRDDKISLRSVRAQLESMGRSASNKAIVSHLSNLRAVGDLTAASKGGRPSKLHRDANSIYGTAGQFFYAP